MREGVVLWPVNGRPGAKARLHLVGVREAKALRLIPRRKPEGYGLKGPKSSCRVVSSGSFTAFRMTAGTCKSSGKSKGNDKNKSNSRSLRDDKQKSNGNGKECGGAGDRLFLLIRFNYLRGGGRR
jgi:hypothetical protein